MANFFDYSKLTLATRFGSKKPMYYALVYPEMAQTLVSLWDTTYSKLHVEIRACLGNIVTIVQDDDMMKMRLNPSMKWVHTNAACVRILYDAGVLKVSDVYTQVSKALGKKVTAEQLSGVLNRLTKSKDICDAFEAFADYWILHEAADRLTVANKHVDDAILDVIRKFVEENEKYVTGLFNYDFKLRGILGHEHETRGESIADLRNNIRRGSLVEMNGDTERSVFDLNDAYMESEEFARRVQLCCTGYNDPSIAGLLLARMFQPMIIVKSMEGALGTELTVDEAMAYLKHRGNDLLLENIQNALDCWDAFEEEFDFSEASPQEAFDNMHKFLHVNSADLTEEGLAVLSCLTNCVKPILGCSGVYEKTTRAGLETVITYDRFFQEQMNTFGQLMMEPRPLPSVIKAFLVDGMYGAGKRRVVTDMYECDQLPAEMLANLDKAFDEAYEVYNKDGNLNALADAERQKAKQDTRLIAVSLDAIRDAGGDEAPWEEFISDGTVDSTWEAILSVGNMSI